MMISLEIVNGLKSILEDFYGKEDFYPLHIPVFDHVEQQYLKECIESTFVSSVGKQIDEVEKMLVEFTGAKYAVAVVNGTAAQQVALRLAGVEKDTEVITQAMTFVATTNAILYNGAIPVFVDVDKENMGLCPKSLRDFLEINAEMKNGQCFNKTSGKRISAVTPMHTFGFAASIIEIKAVCDEWNIPLVEDSAEAVGSFLDGKHLGTFGLLGVLSFNGNKVITAGGGGAILTNDEELAKKAKYLTTTAKVPHKWEYVHDEMGYNFRMPNLNASLLKAQLEKLPTLLASKRELTNRYIEFFSDKSIEFKTEQAPNKTNYWLNTILLENRAERDEFLEATNSNGIMTRPAWTLMNELPMFKECQTTDLTNSIWLADRIVNITSSPKL